MDKITDTLNLLFEAKKEFTIIFQKEDGTTYEQLVTYSEEYEDASNLMQWTVSDSGGIHCNVQTEFRTPYGESYFEEEDLYYGEVEKVEKLII